MRTGQPDGGSLSRGRPRGALTLSRDAALAARLLAVIEDDIIPLTRKGVAAGNKIFGAALLRKSDLSTIIAGTNAETENPLWHGEIATIKAYYEMVNADESRRVAPSDTLFLTTHEPCPLCLSAIAWGGYDNFFYLFSHEDSRDDFAIGHDLRILKEVFRQEPGGYARQNAYWTGRAIVDMIEGCDAAEREPLENRLSAIRAAYAEMSEIYQASKGDARNIPLK